MQRFFSKRAWLLAAIAVSVFALAASLLCLLNHESVPKRLAAKESLTDARHVDVTVLGDSRSRNIPVVFTVRNPGPKTVRILGIQSSCTCLGADVDTRELLAGVAAQLTLNVRLTPHERTKQVSCVLITDDSNEKHKRFSAKLNVMQPVQFEGESYDFGQLRLNDAVSREISLLFCTRGTSPPKVNDVGGNTPSIAAVCDSNRISTTPVNDLVVHRLPIVVTFKPDEATIGVPLTLRASAIVDGVALSAESPLLWCLERQFALSPQRAVLSNGDSNSPQPVLIIVRRKDNGPLEIKGVRSNSKLISASVTPATNAREAAIEVRLLPVDSFPDRLVSTIVVMTDDPLESRLIIPVVFMRSNSN